jgi:hypothetical protein
MVGYAHLSTVTSFGQTDKLPAITAKSAEAPAKSAEAPAEPAEAPHRPGAAPSADCMYHVQGAAQHQSDFILPGAVMYPGYTAPAGARHDAALPRVEQLLLVITILLCLILVCSLISAIACACKGNN